MSEPAKPQRKRMRVPISCESCRRRKIKCDKARPRCTSCFKFNAECKYEEVKASKSKQNYKHILNFGNMTSTINPSKKPVVGAQMDNFRVTTPQSHSMPTLKTAFVAQPAPVSIVRDPYASQYSETTVNPSSLPSHADDVINFYHGYSSLQVSDSRVLSHGPLSWITLVKRDPFLKIVWLKVLRSKMSDSLIIRPAKSVEDDVRDADDEAPAELGEGPGKGSAYRNRSVGFSAAYKPDSELGTIKYILQLLPEKRYIWILIDRFFEFVYPMMPYLDHENFMKQIIKVVGPRSSELIRLQHLGINKRLDFASAGIILLMMRLAHLSIMNNSEIYSPDLLPELKQVLDVVDTKEFPTAAQYCLNQFRLLRSSSLEILQCALYMRIYQRFSPEDGDGADSDSRIYNGMLLQMAISIGLNRDPETLLVNRNTKRCQLRRKIWFALLQLETFHDFVLGNPSYCRIISYDCKKPEFNTESFNSPSLETERFVLHWISEYDKKLPLLSQMNDLVLNLKGDTKVVQILEVIHKIETMIAQTHSSFQDVLKLPTTTHTERLYKVKSIQIYVESNLSIFCVYYHLFVKYDEEGNDKALLHYFCKVLKLSNEFMVTLPQILNKLHKYVGHGFDYFLTQSILISLHRLIQGYFTSFARLSHYSVLLLSSSNSDSTDTAQLLKVVDKMKESILKHFEIHLKELKKLTPKYYYAWKMFKAQHLIFKVMSMGPLFVLRDGMLVFNEEKVEITFPQKSFLANLSVAQLKNLQPSKENSKKHARSEDDDILDRSNSLFPHDPSSKRSSQQATSPAALSNILNDSSTNSTISISPTSNSNEMKNASVTEADNIWIEFLNKKKANDLDEDIWYEDEQKILEEAEQHRQLQQPDFSSLLVMQPSLSHTSSRTSTEKLLRSGSSDPPMSAGFPEVASTFSNPSQGQPVPSNKTAGQQHILQNSGNQTINLNGLLEFPLNFGQAFESSEYPFNDFL